jgi:hypothetical protein
VTEVKSMKAGPSWLLRAALICLMLVQLSGCAQHGSGSGSGSGGGGGSTTPDTSLIGNWQFQATSTGNPPFTSLSGFVNEPGIAGDSTLTTASLQIQSNSCFSGTKVVDFEGFTKAPLAQLTSFPSNSQTITLGLSQQCTGVSLCGTFTIAGGCADQATGSIVGVKYTQLSGTFSGAASSTASLKISISQSSQGTGQGSLQVSGTMAFTGLPCSTSASIDSTQSYVSGSSLHLVALTNAAVNPQLVIDSTINPAASTMTLNTISFADNSCFAPFNGLTLSNTP